MNRHRSIRSVAVVFALLFLLHSGCSCRDGTKSDIVTVRGDATVKSDAFSRGTDILKASERAYAKLRSYQGTIKITSAAQFPGRTLNETRHFKVWYERPNRIRLEGKDSNGDNILIISDGTTVYERWDAMDKPTREPFDQLTGLLLKYTGVSLGATDTLPGILLQCEWSAQTFFLPHGKLLPALASKARFDEVAEVDGHKCYRVVCEREILTWTLYVDTETHLIRRIEETASAEQMAAQRRHGGGGFSGTISGTNLRQDFEIEAVDKPISPSKFKIP